MFKLLNKKLLSALVAISSLSTLNSSLTAEDCCPLECNDNRLYIGVFGGQLFSDSTKFIQSGTAFFTEAQGGPLAVDARGHAKKNSIGYGGIQIGYELRKSDCSDWNISPAAELEALWYRQTYKAHLINRAGRLEEHDFAVSFPTNVGVYLANGVISINSSCLRNFTPYVGLGVGAANLCIRKAQSVQVDPPEPGVNHFNSDRSDVTWAFAAQAKLGLRFNFCERFHIFAEYRFLYLDSSRYLLGSTVYPDHAETSTWDVNRKGTYYNAYTLGFQFDL